MAIMVKAKASEHIAAAMHEIGDSSSPWRPALLMQLEHLKAVAVMHEMYAEKQDIAPRQTALGHKPAGITVEAHSVNTDAALAALECSD